MKRQERVSINKYIKGFSFSVTLEEFDNQIKIKVIKDDASCKALFNKYEQNQKELKDAITDECEKCIEEEKGNSHYNIISEPLYIFTEENFVYEMSFSD